jgi:predicted nucleic acid-binding Zn ribbon protein
LCESKYTPSHRNVVNSGDIIGISEVDCSQNGIEIMRKMPPDISGHPLIMLLIVELISHWLTVQE